MIDTRVAAVALNPQFGDLPAMEEKIVRWTRRAAAERADVVIFPEGILTTYDVPNIAACAIPLDSPVLRRIQAAAAQAGVIVSVGFLERSSLGFHVSNVHLGRDVFLPCRKCHLTESEKALCVAGDRIVVQHLPRCVVGTLICYDSAFPRATETLVRKGAEILVHSSCHAFYSAGETRDYPAAIHKRRNHILKYWRARAYDYSCFAVQVDNVGEASNGEWFPGYMAVFGPDGEPIVEGTRGEEDMIVADLSAAFLDKARAEWIGHFRAMADARPELYTP